jgi:hypothetical protein
MRIYGQLHGAKADARRGFSLLEAVCAIWALTLIMFLGVTTLLGAMKIEKAGTAASDRQTFLTTAADQFRDDVATAIEAPDRVGEVDAGDDSLILRKGDDRYVFYRAEEGRLERSVVARPNAMLQWIPLGGNWDTIEFVRSGPNGRLITLRLCQAVEIGRRQRPTEVSAALGGDRR